MPVSGLADLAGRVLAGRYRLRAAIGTGASGRVYLADDTRLRRRVAVKVLHAALAEDTGFLRRFRSEAQLAASLHHPNVMAVYDWGEDGVPFMVLELLEGGSVRSMLDRDHDLTPAQAAHIGAQVCSALEYAHARGLVHRDIKPANLLFDEHGVVRVADFGLARALAEASWTEPAGTVLGTARYASPEQATGARLDGRSDLYALALVLYESVMGTVPFLADTPIGTLAARMNQELTAPPELGPLGRVVERAARSDPSERYPDAGTMRAALRDAIASLPPAGPLTLAGTGEITNDPHPTQIRRRGGGALFDQDVSAGDTGFLDEIAIVDEPERALEHQRRNRGSLVSTVIVVALVIAALTAGAIAVAGAVPATVASPNLVGQPRDAAAARATEVGLLMRVVGRRPADDPSGTVIQQQPLAGRSLEDGEAIGVVVSRGPPSVAVPDVKTKSETDAVATLDQAGFTHTTERRNDETIPKDIVIDQVPGADAKVARDSSVTLIVSDGPAPVPVPDVAGKGFDDAKAALAAAKLGATRKDEFSDSVEAGVVIRTEPAATQVAPRDSAVVVVVSKGPDLVTVPNVIGLTQDEAQTELEGAALNVGNARNPGKDKTVIASDPVPGSKVKRGSDVDLLFAR